ncbi:MAG: hypothetical protein EXR91_07420 [Gemmatimonadetes bacterium]|nr:hypothetical protein [Gemmatimonadota bacterium]
MTPGLLLKVGGALVALVWGVWMGLPARYTQSVEEIDKVMEAGGGRRRTVKRVFTPMSWVTRNAEARAPRPGRGFRLQSPKDR